MASTKIESGVQLFSRLNYRGVVLKLSPLFLEGPYPNEIVELTGPSESGKTSLITDFLARCILPLRFGGKNCGALLINTDHHFNTLKLINVMEILIMEFGNKLDVDVNTIIKDSLKNFFVLNCYNSHQMQLTFVNLQRILSENTNIGLIVLDSLSTYYWEYRISKGIISWQHYHLKMLDALKNAIQNSNVVTIFTRIEIEPANVKGNILLKESYKITLKKHLDSFLAVVTDNVRNFENTIMYTMEDTIRF